MKNLRAVPQQKKLLEFLETQPLIAFDYDGTLAPIVQKAAQARMRPETRRLLKSLCALYTCAVMTGRAREDALTHLKGISFAQVIGNHGVEWSDPELGASPSDLQRMVESVDRWVTRLHEELGDLDGVFIENKRLSLSVHYRQAKHKARVIRRIEEALSTIRGARLIGGKQVFNVLPKGVKGKGASLLELKRIYRKKTALFAGDDLNDEEVFELSERQRVFKIRVGKSVASHADYFIRTQEDMDWLLKTLVEAARV